MDLTPQSTLAPRDMLSRLVRQENPVSDLLAFLATSSPNRLCEKLGLPQGPYTFHREYAIKNRQLDILVEADDGQPAAIIEVKGAAEEHNNQLHEYAEWARATAASREPVLVVAPFDNEDFEAAEGWCVISLRELFDVWAGDPERPELSWLAGQVCDIFDAWDAEAEAPLKHRSGHYVATVATRRTARALNQRLAAHTNQGECKPFGTKGPNPAIGAWLPLPIDTRFAPPSGDVYLLLDIRQASHTDPHKPWNMRLLIDVDGHDPDDAEEALKCATKIAQEVYPALSINQVRGYGEDRLHISGNQRGLKRNVSGNPTLDDFFFDKPKSGSFRRVGVKYNVDLPEHDRVEVEEFCFSVLTGAHRAIRDFLAVESAPNP